MPSAPHSARFARTVLIGLALGISGMPAAASSIFIDPIRVELSQDRKIGAIRVVNQDGAPVSIRVSALKWEQKDGQDVHADTSDVIASPPIFTIPPNGTQLLRVGLRGGTASAFKAYRLIVEEIPAPAEESDGVRVTLRLNLPVYAAPVKGRGEPLRWALAQDNAGMRPVQVRTIRAVTATGKPVVLSSAMGVVLPGSMRRWVVDAPIRPNKDATLRAIAGTDAGEQPFTIPAQHP
jgi:fimbrial chaperone protein